ncbi:hypothetical protein [Gaetbulibacter aestuarii]|uniref:Lipoprotein n=1 Tax=Gaetbulibacter aestuarii TaxID=1502358 RepID=A0ABW7MVQ1_9FLAO
MKYLFILLSFFLTENGCCNKNNIDQEALSFEYNATSRGLFQQITIDKNKIKTISARGEKPIEKACPDDLWASLVNNLDSLDLKTIENLKAPSDKRLFDGAAHASLSINYKDKTYKSPSFDHGNPPKAIASLVKVIRSAAENIE